MKKTIDQMTTDEWSKYAEELDLAEQLELDLRPDLHYLTLQDFLEFENETEILPNKDINDKGLYCPAIDICYIGTECVTDQEDLILTLLHECVHHRYPNFNDDEAESMAYITFRDNNILVTYIDGNYQIEDFGGEKEIPLDKLKGG